MRQSPDKADDRSKEHLTWLVDSRSRNQKCSLDLFILLESNPSVNSFIDFQQIAQALTATAFSLWRAVFLSDSKGSADDQMADLNTFLGNLISNNTIAYQQDKNAREFTFRYYLSDANLRLDNITQRFPSILNPKEFIASGADIKSEWSNAQAALDVALRRFGEQLRGKSQS